MSHGPLVTKYPSQVRYEKKHPLISVRLTKELKEMIDAVRGNMSYSDVIKLKLFESVEICKAAENRYKITIPCAVCGKPIEVVPNGTIHQDILNRFKEKGWKHGTC